MMLLLVFDVSLYGFELRRTYGKIRIAGLPLKMTKARLGLKPSVRDAFQFFDPFSLSNRSSESGKQMNVIFDATNPYWWAIKAF